MPPPGLLCFVRNDDHRCGCNLHSSGRARLPRLSLFDHDAGTQLRDSSARGCASSQQHFPDSRRGRRDAGREPAASSKPPWSRKICRQAAPARALRRAGLVGLGAADAIAPRPAHSPGGWRHACRRCSRSKARPGSPAPRKSFPICRTVRKRFRIAPRAVRSSPVFMASVYGRLRAVTHVTLRRSAHSAESRRVRL